MAIQNTSNIPFSQAGLISYSSCKNMVVTVTKETSVDLLPANQNRIYAAFINNSAVPVTLILGERSEGSIDKGIPLNPSGSYELNLLNLYRGKVSVTVVEDEAKISIVECNEDP